MTHRKAPTSLWGHSVHLTDPYRTAKDDEERPGVVPPKTLSALSREIGPCVYFIRCRDGLIKIGHTSNIAQRKRSFGAGWQHILAIVPGTLQDESALLSRFAACLAHGREYFNPAPELVAHINEIRERMGVQPIAA